MQVSSVDIMRIPNVGRTSLNGAKEVLSRLNLQFDMALDGWDDEAAWAQREKLGRQILRHLYEISGEAIGAGGCLEDELCGLIASADTGRNVELLLSLYGFDGTEPKTLETVGQSFDLTRERVRQISDRARIRLAKRWLAGLAPWVVLNSRSLWAQRGSPSRIPLASTDNATVCTALLLKRSGGTIQSLRSRSNSRHRA